MINLPKDSTEPVTATSNSHATTRKCLLLHVEATTYISHKLEYVKLDRDFEYDIYFVTGRGSQNWGLGDPGGEVLDDPSESGWTRAKRTARLALKILRGDYSVAFVAGWGTLTLVGISFLLTVSGTPFCLDSDTQLAKSRRGVKEAVKNMVYPILFGWASALFPAGKRQAEFFEAYGVSSDRIHLQHMTVDVKQIVNLPIVEKREFRRAHGIAEDSVVYIFVGRLEPVKAVQVLFAAFEQVSAKIAKSALVIVGDGSLRGEAAAFAERVPGVRYVGRQGFAGVVQWMKASDVFVLPSKVEPWGLVVNEAMACGLPVIATDQVGAVDDLVVEGENGFVVPAGDVAGLAEAMLKLARDSGLCKRMGETSEQIIAPWTIEAELANLKEVLARVSR